MSFGRLETNRLLLRAVESDDVDALQARRGHPQVNQFLMWDSPYPRERAEGLVSEVLEMDGPANESWWMLTIVEKATGDIVADLAFYMSWEMRTAEIGYTMHPDYWGRGYVSEAVEEAIRWLFTDIGVTRILAKIHPDNRASARVLERSGLVFEGHTKNSFWAGDENTDDWIYGMTKPMWKAWLTRPRHPATNVALDTVHRGNLTALLELNPHASQLIFTESASRLIARSLTPDEDGDEAHQRWSRAIVADGTPVGILAFEVLSAVPKDATLTAFLIDRLHQRRGIGSTAFGLAIGELEAAGVETISTSWGLQRGSPKPFFLELGFDETAHSANGLGEAKFSIG